MKILYIHTGRIEESKANSIQTLQMCDAFAKCGHEVTYAVNSYTLNSAEASNRIQRELGTDNLLFEVLTYQGSNICGRFRSIGCVPAINQLITSRSHDILFIREPVILPLIRPTSPSIIFEAHNYITFPDGGPLDSLWRRLVVKRSRRANLRLFITISQALAQWWINHGVPENKICVLHDAVNPDLFPDTIVKAESRAKLSIPDNKPVVVYAGSLYNDRCIPDIIKLAGLRRNVLFIVVGGPEEAKAKYSADAKLAGIENIIFTGHVPHKSIPLYLSAADVLLMLWSDKVPTINFCSPLKVFEYMAAGRIIVGHGFPTIKEVLTHGRNAYLAEPSDFDSLAHNLEQALDNPDARMAESARSLVLQKYTWQKRCETIIRRTQE